MNQRSLFLLLLLAGCSPAPASTPASTSDTAPVSTAATAAPAASPGAVPTATPTPPPPFQGQAMLPGGAFAGATVEVLGLGGPPALTSAQTDADGRFTLPLLSAPPAAGTGLELVARKGSQAMGSMLIAAGGANLIAAGGANLIAAGGANLIAAGGANLIAAGGANLIAAGGANFGLLDAPHPDAVLNVGTTTALAFLADNLAVARQDALARRKTQDAAPHPTMTQLFAAFDQVRAAAQDTFNGLAPSKRQDLESAVLGALSPDGSVGSSPALQATLAQLAEANPALKAAVAAAKAQLAAPPPPPPAPTGGGGSGGAPAPTPTPALSKAAPEVAEVGSTAAVPVKAPAPAGDADLTPPTSGVPVPAAVDHSGDAALTDPTATLPVAPVASH